MKIASPECSDEAISFGLKQISGGDRLRRVRVRVPVQ